MGSKNKKNKETEPERRSSVHVSGKQRHGERAKVITDPRFASVHSDPRFQKVSKHKSKVAIDSRFHRMFTDKSFTSSNTRIDKRGKPKKDSSQNPLKHYYRLEEESEERKRIEEGRSKEADSEDSKGSESDDSGNESENANLEKIGSLKLKRNGSLSSDSRLKRALESSESESDNEEEEEEIADEEVEEEEVGGDTSSTSTTDSDEEDDTYEEEEETFAQEENIPEIDKETHRLAVVNMDWKNVKAIDLYVLLSSFLPKGGQILSVAVYPSEFGLKRMEEEAVRGPVDLFDDEESEENDDNDEIDNEKLRAYELSRLRYYYAVVECNSSATADYLYKSCDGVEFERSSNKLDLRFIPDSMEFKHPPQDVATEAPANYEGLDFHTQALQDSKIHLTWDEDEPQRKKTMKRKLNADQLAHIELKEFLASDESETDEDENDNTVEDKSAKRQKKQDMYRALVQSGGGSDEEEDGQDMEVTFNTGLEDISKRILEKKDKKSETVWEAYLRTRRERKKARKNRSKNSSEDESSDTDREPTEQPDDFFVEPSVEGSKVAQGRSSHKGKQHQESAEEAEASRAELELLLADDNGADTSLKGYNLRPKKSDGKRGKEIPDDEKLPVVDYDDPRFSSLFTSPLFALDPTDPQFKRSAACARQMAQKQHKGGQENGGGKEPTDAPRHSQLSKNKEKEGEHLRSAGMSTKKEKHELSSLVRSIKMKSKQVPLLSNSKETKKFGKSQLDSRAKK